MTDGMPLLVKLALGSLAVVVLLPVFFRSVLRVLFFPRYGFRVWGAEHIPARGPVVVIANHVTWIDGLFLGAVFRRRGKILVNSAFLPTRFLRWYVSLVGVIPVPFSGPKAQRAAIDACRKALDRGEAVAVFPEGQLTRNGFMGSFYRGLELILKNKPDVPVVPVYLDNLWGSIWSCSDGRTVIKRPRGLRRVIGVSCLEPLTGPVDLFRYRQAMVEASVPPVNRRKGKPIELDTIDLSLPHFLHPKYGLLTASTPDFHSGDVHQTGHRQGTVGQALPGVAIRAVDEMGTPLGYDAVGRLQALIAGQGDHWHGLGHRGSVDKDGFVRLI